MKLDVLRRLRDRLLGEGKTSDVDLSTLSQDDFWDLIDKAPADKYTTVMKIDWGRRQRGQGKRSGGMVMGAMSDAPRGVKSYPNVLGSAPLSAHEKEEVEGMETGQKILLAQALAAGFSSDVAFLVAYTRGNYAMSRREAYERAMYHLRK